MQSAIRQCRAGRVVNARFFCNDDLVTGMEDLCREHQIVQGVIKGGLGSLFKSGLEVMTDEGVPRTINVQGFAVEILSMHGHVRCDRDGNTEVELYGIVANNAGEVFAGRFVKGSSPVCITIEVMVQEWLD
ncbi:MAG: PPC domain-containing DNA-binding protein [Advenella sp.]|uniref:PPC domain-containing DNA-binding protein n=1 Tax=Advenella sp. S44 TaxID=1982755 RepID=UPI0013747A0A|nr:PPC domain-containing DNA-binding protein [Advenella sp. S44]